MDKTAVFFLDKLQQTRDPSVSVLFGLALVQTAAGIGAGFLLFPAEASLIGVFLAAMAQARTVELLLARNRDDIWQRRRTSTQANRKLAGSLLAIFLGVLLAYSVSALVVPEERLLDLFERQIGDYGGHSITDVVFDDFGGLLGNNLLVLVVCFLFSLLYRHGGMLLVLAWNASVWGVVFPWIARTAPDAVDGGALLYFLRSFLCIFPHLLLEAAAYISIAMAGVFLSKGVQKYGLGSQEFHQVASASARVGAVAATLLVVAGAVEAWLTPALIAALF